MIVARIAFRNKQLFWYALYDHTAEDYEIKGYDEYGNPIYGNQIGTSTRYKSPVAAYGNISAAKGEVVARQFGDDDLYDKVIVVGDRETPINEYTVLWIDSTPEFDDNGALKVNANGDYVTPWDYIVRKVARGLPNFGNAVIAVSKVSVT